MTSTSRQKDAMSSVMEEEYILNADSELTLRPLFDNGLLPDYLWLRKHFARFAKSQTIKPYHSSFFALFIKQVFKRETDASKQFMSNYDQRRTLNFLKKQVKAHLEITEILKSDSKRIGFHKPVSKYSKPEEFPVIKALKGTEKLVKARVVYESQALPSPVVNIGGGVKNFLPDSEMIDLSQGKNVNDMTKEKIAMSSVSMNQSVYHVKPEILHELLKRPFVGSYTYEHRAEFKDKKSDWAIVSGMIGRRNYSNEYSYHPRFFQKRNCFTMTPSVDFAGPRVIYVNNVVRPPRHIKLKLSQEVAVSPLPVFEKHKTRSIRELGSLPLMDITLTDFYQSLKIDGIYGKLFFDGTRFVFRTRHGIQYALKMEAPSTKLEFNVEAIFDNEHKKASFYFLSCINGSYLWEDLKLFQKQYPGFGNKDYYLVPPGKVFRLPTSPLPSDGVVYTPVLSTSMSYGYKDKFALFSTHFFFKPLRTYDVSYNYVRDLVRKKPKDVILHNPELTKDKRYYQAHGKLMGFNPFVYELSVMYDEALHTYKYFVHHTRIDKSKVQDNQKIEEPPDPLQEKGVFFYTQYANDYNMAASRFLSSFSTQRRLLLPDVVSDRYDFYDSVVKHLISEKQPINELKVTDLYNLLLTFYDPATAELFIMMAVKCPTVHKKYGIIRNRIVCTLTFFFKLPQDYGLSWLFDDYDTPSVVEPRS